MLHQARAGAVTLGPIPDAPIRSIVLRVLGESRTASIGAAANLCSASSRRAKAQVDYIGRSRHTVGASQRGAHRRVPSRLRPAQHQETRA
jgi:hypothetical protein